MESPTGAGGGARKDHRDHDALHRGGEAGKRRRPHEEREAARRGPAPGQSLTIQVGKLLKTSQIILSLDNSSLTLVFLRYTVIVMTRVPEIVQK